MKKYNGDGPGYGLFDFASTARELDLALVETPPLHMPIESATWAEEPVQLSRSLRPYRSFGKRAFDILIVLASLPFTLPVIGFAALALWIEGGGPFYTQQRVGRRGRAFSILKLRTMVRDADAVLEQILATDPVLRAEWDTLQKLKDDPRVTPVGAFLRATSLDELPQLWNVLRGDMSIVGPRPMMLDQKDMYGDLRAYAALRPGITGLWQVSARNGNAFAYRNEVDGAYERSVTFGKDLAIMFKTIGVVLRQTGY